MKQTITAMYCIVELLYITVSDTQKMYIFIYSIKKVHYYIR